MFTSRILSIITGLIFTILITRNLTPQTFGVWQNVGDWLGYFTVVATVLPSWSLRYVARGVKGSAETGLAFNLLVGGLLTVVYGLASGFMGGLVGVSPLIFALASVQVLELYLVPAFEAVANALRPELIAYGQMLREVVKVGLAYLLVMTLDLGIFGAILTVTAVYFVDIVFLASRFPWALKCRLNWGLLKEWFKGSLLTLYDLGVGRLWTLDMLMLALLVGVEARALYGAAYLVAGLVSYAVSLSVGLYPRLLTGGGAGDVETAFKATLMFAVPMTVGVIVYAEPYLTVLNPVYVQGRVILTTLAVNFLLGCFTQIYKTTIYGLEKVDAEGNLTLTRLRRSSFFLLPTVGFTATVIYLPTLYYLLTRVVKTPPAAGVTVAVLTLLFQAIWAAIFNRKTRKTINFKFPTKSLLKYFVASILMAVVLLASPKPTRILFLFAGTLLGAFTYFLTLALIDNETRIVISKLLKACKLQIG